MSDIRFNRWLHQSGTGGVSQDSSGNIGIGTTVPTMALDVRGDVNIGNTININNASGIISATTFTGTTGTFSGNVSAVDATFTGNVTIGGTLTYEDVANIDAVGIITAQKDILIGRNLNVTGVSTGTKFNSTTSPNYVISDGTTEKGYIGYNANDPFIGRKNGVGLAFQNNKVRPVDGDNGSPSSNTVDLGEPTYKFKDAYLTGTVNSAGINATGVATATTFSGNLTGNVTGNVTGDLTGNLAGISSIAAISSSISDTAVDIFVYDTRKDSDGGAWRKRTQHTSWYNETLNTATRGSRKEFPAVAVIVTEDTKVTIYDGDDPDLPMWMVFLSGPNSSNERLLRYALNKASAMLNAVLCVATRDTLSYISFIDEYHNLYHTQDEYYFAARTGIVDRNTIIGEPEGPTGADGIASSAANDVAMTVLPNAPIDDATGLPKPTIAVATDAGVSVITDSGSVYDLTTSDVYDSYGKVEFGDNNRLYYTANGTQVLYSRAIPYADQNYTAYNTQNTNRVMFPTMDHGGFTSGHPVRLLGTNGSIPLLIVKNKASGSNETGYAPAGFGIRPGLTFIDEGETNPTSMVAYATTSYNTGWMHGDIKGAFVSDTDTTNVTGSEKIANYNFAADFSTQWESVNNATTSYDATNDRVTVTSTQNYSGIQLKSASLPTLTAGKRYIMTVDIHSINNPIYFGVVSGLTVNNVNAAGVWTGVFTASNVTEVFVKKPTGSNSTFVLNSVSIREAEEDRSVNNKAIQVFGTVTKSAVATGADLVAYSGWSSSNHLRQPPNSSMNIGTGDAYIMIWFKTTSGSANLMMMSYEGGANGTSDYGKPFNLRYEVGKVRGWASHNAFSTHDDVIDTKTTNDGQWHCAAWVKRGQVFELYVDGEFIGSDTGSVGSNALSDANSELVIGGRKRGHAPGTCEEPFPGSLALARIGKSAPSAEQIKKMYEDEKVLFRENAKATLYGSSDAVTALGYDEDTELLHVGTSAGRSDFQGLRRINNTTTAVTTAISASDDLIAEQ